METKSRLVVATAGGSGGFGVTADGHRAFFWSDHNDKELDNGE